MKTTVAKWLLFIILLIAVGGCAATELVRIKSHGQREDVFKEVQDKGEIPKGYADLMIQCSIKTHLEGEYLLERGGFHGKPNYPFLLNIDGQSITWEVNGRKEIAPNNDQKGQRNDEQGEGMKYILEKRIRLKAGLHNIFFALPSEIVYSEIEITLKEGQLQLVEFRPVYRGKTRAFRNFFNGIAGLETQLMG